MQKKKVGQIRQRALELSVGGRGMRGCEEHTLAEVEINFFNEYFTFNMVTLLALVAMQKRYEYISKIVRHFNLTCGIYGCPGICFLCAYVLFFFLVLKFA